MAPFALVAATAGLLAGSAPARAPSARAGPVVMAHDRRALLAAALASSLLPLAAQAKIDSVNPANNYYFPQAKFRYLPRIFRAWIASSQLAPQAINEGDWVAVQEAWNRLDDATNAMPLYTSAVEGQRSTKRKKKSEEQKIMMVAQKDYAAAVKDLQAAINKKDKSKALAAISKTTESLKTYRELAKIDKEDGGVIQLPVGNAMEAGHGGAPLGYVIPAFRGGGMKNDFALR